MTKKGEVAGTSPTKVDLKEGETYYWCACGKSAKQPFCDGSHKGTGFMHVKWEHDCDESRFLCNCKQTSNPPYCDGSHMKLQDKS